MSDTAKQYFDEPTGRYTGYRGKVHPIHGAVTQDYSVKPGISIGSAISSIQKIKRRMGGY